MIPTNLASISGIDKIQEIEYAFISSEILLGDAKRMAKKFIVKSKTSRGHYKADACVVWCFDDRFTESRKRLFKKLGLKHIDRIIVAGGAKDLAAKENSLGKKYLLKQILASIRLHHARLVILMTHSDCGAYGGLTAFSNNIGREFSRHTKDQKKAVATVRNAVPHGVRVKTAFADFENIRYI
jgi:hypothetical protein